MSGGTIPLLSVLASGYLDMFTLQVAAKNIKASDKQVPSPDSESVSDLCVCVCKRRGCATLTG